MPKSKASKRRENDFSTYMHETALEEIMSVPNRKFLHCREDVYRHGREIEGDDDDYEAPSDYSHATEGRRLADGFRMLGAGE